MDGQQPLPEPQTQTAGLFVLLAAPKSDSLGPRRAPISAESAMDHEAAQRKREAQAVAATQGRDRGELAVERRPAVQQLLQSRGPPPQTPMIAGRSQRTATGPKSAAGDTFLGKAPTSGMPAVLDQSGAGGSDLIGGLKLRNHPRSARGAVARWFGW